MVDKNDPQIVHRRRTGRRDHRIDPSVVKALQDDQFIPVIQPDRLRRAERELQHQRRPRGQQAGDRAQGES